MFLRGGFLSSRFLSQTQRERALVAKLEDTRAGIAVIADLMRTLAALEDKRAHLTQKAVREGGDRACVDAAHVDGVVSRSKGTAEALDRITEALEGLAASLRDL